MSDYIIKVENLSKSYLIQHQQERYTALRDVLASNARHLGQRLLGRSNGHSPSQEEFWALNDVSFEVKPGERVGIIGRNGAGKSTLLKILSRITEPTRGRVRIRGRVASLLEVGTGFHPELTGRENIYLNGAILGMSRAEIKRKFDEIVAFSEVEKFLDTPVKRYSSGMYVRLAFAVAAHLEPEILVVDEVLAVGDAAFQKKCLGKMEEVAGEGRTVLFVSHNMGAILNLCSSGLFLKNGKIDFCGDAKDAIQRYNLSVLATNSNSKGLAPHVIYNKALEKAIQRGFAITKVEVLDTHGIPKPVLSTWDNITLRIWYYSNQYIQNGSVIFQLRTIDGLSLFTLSTRPDGILPLTIEPGEHFVDCVISQLPLAAGEYILGIGLAIPKVEMLWWQPELCRLIVNQEDVYGSGIAPAAPRSQIAVQHYWRLKL